MGLTADDYVLLRRYADGRDQSAFAELMRRHVDMVYAASLRRVGHRAMADDVTQATFMILARKAKSIRQRGREPLSAWLLNVVRYAAANAIKIEGRRRKHEQAAALRLADRQRGAGCSPDPSQVILWQEIARRLDDAVLRLSGSHRRAVLLRYYENQPIGAMASQLQLSEGAVRQLLTRATDKLRQILSKQGAAIVPIDALALERLLQSHVTAAAPTVVKAACAAAAGSAAAAAGMDASGAGASIAKGAIKMMAWTKTQIAAGVIVAATVGGAGGTLVIRTALAQGQPAATHAKNPAAGNAPAAPAVQLDKDANNGIVSVATAAPVVVATVPQAGATDVDAGRKKPRR